MEVDEETGKSSLPSFYAYDLPEAKVTMVFKVPTDDGCVTNVEINSNITYENFRYRIAESMEVPVGQMNVAYTLSTWGAKEDPSVLKSVAHLVGLWDDVKKERERLEKARRKGNNAKELYVKIKDLNASNGAKPSGGGKNKKVIRLHSQRETADHYILYVDKDRDSEDRQQDNGA